MSIYFKAKTEWNKKTKRSQSQETLKIVLGYIK